jgi:hypothetical protein
MGSATAGRLADASGHTAAFAVTVSAGAAALVLAAVAQPLLRSVVRRPVEGAPAGRPAVAAGRSAGHRP